MGAVDSQAYRQRVRVETVNSAQKRAIGVNVLSRISGRRRKELAPRHLPTTRKGQ